MQTNNIITSNKRYKNILRFFSKYESIYMQPNIKIQWEDANDHILTDKFKKKYIDFTSGIFAVNIGYKNKHLINSILKVLKKGIWHTYLFYNSYRETYIKKLIKFVGQKKLSKCHLVSSGTEATETALKLVRTYGGSINKKKIGIICLHGNWHGRTVGSQMLSGNNKQSEWIGYFDKKIFHISFPYPWVMKNKNIKSFFYSSLKKVFGKNFNYKKNISAILLETFQGWGAIFYPKSYVKEVEKFCLKNNILLCFDEMQSGFARTGKKFGFEHYNVKPDLICCGKGMGSGFPLSGVLTNDKIINNNSVSGLSSTHSANALVCAAGIATIDEINRNKLVYKSLKLGNFFHKKLNLIKNKYQLIISHALGKGLIAALIFKNTKNMTAKQIADFVSLECLYNGLLLCNTGRESIKLGPPLTISKKNLIKSLNILENAIKKVTLL
jgi:4-aminobutyrate aminotransferase/(S)-3-amino-2-methylpropionate transaminase